MFKNHSRNFSIFTAAIFLFLLAVILYPNGQARASGVVGTCNESTFSSILATGGTITFNCDGVINITSVKTISTDTTIDARGHNITLDGGGATRVFNVNTGVALTLINMTVQNASAGTGGAIWTRGGILTIQNSQFITNTATGAAGSGGGAIFADVVNITGTLPARVTIENSLFENNNAPGHGGAIFVDGGEGGRNVGAFINIKNSTFRNNRTTGDGGGGAILANFHVTLNSEGSLYVNNQARGNGGAIGTVLGDVLVNLANNTFSGNSANLDGTGGAGGALDLKDSYLVHNTFYGNSVIISGTTTHLGSAIHWATTSLTVVSRDNIFHNNTGSNFECMVANKAHYGSGNLTDDGSCNSNGAAAPVNNFETTLRNNGGPTLTHALLTGSNAIDAASACTYASTGTNPLFSNGTAVLRDQRGAARPYDGDGLFDAVECDKGAYEVRPVRQTVCGSPLSGVQTFVFSPNRTVTIDIITPGSLNCITVEHMGRQHEAGTEEIQASNDWWRISGNVDSGFDVNLTLPANYVPDTGDEVCRYTGSGTENTWDCEVTSFNSTSLTRNNVTDFSDWAIFEDADPTAVSLVSLRLYSRASAWGDALPAGLLALVGLAWLKRREK